jgi:hypothetical protein
LVASGDAGRYEGRLKWEVFWGGKLKGCIFAS